MLDSGPQSAWSDNKVTCLMKKTRLGSRCVHYPPHCANQPDISHGRCGASDSNNNKMRRALPARPQQCRMHLSLDVCSTLSFSRQIICGRRRKWSIYNNNNHKFISAAASVRSRRVYRYTWKTFFAPRARPNIYNGERKRVTQLLQIVDLFWVHRARPLLAGAERIVPLHGLLYQMMHLQRSRADLLQSVNTPGQRPMWTIIERESAAFFTGISRSGRSLKSDTRWWEDKKCISLLIRYMAAALFVLWHLIYTPVGLFSAAAVGVEVFP